MGPGGLPGASGAAHLVEVEIRGHGRPATGVILEVVVRRGSRSVPGVADVADQVSCVHRPAHTRVLGQVRVVYVVAGAVARVNVDAQTPEPVRPLDGVAVERRPDRRPVWGEDVVALVR